MACSVVRRRGATGSGKTPSPIRASRRRDYNKAAFCRQPQNLPSKGRRRAHHRRVPGSHQSAHPPRGRTSSQTRGARVGGGEVMVATAEMVVTTVGWLGVEEAVASWVATVGWLGVEEAAGWVCGRRRCAALTRTRVSQPGGLGRRSTDMPPTSGTWRRKMCWKLTRWGRRARHPCMHDGSGYSCSPQHPLGTARDTPVGLDLSIAFRRARPRRPSSTRRTRRDGV